ncbi:MAG: AMP-binding protein, partial [Chloroflexi bacterium]|nr:AMP-binding protein [Chloroflexota bacterium]
MPYFDQQTETLSRADLEALQLQKLQAMLAQLYGRNRFYTARWQAAGVAPGEVRALADLSCLPLTTKKELMQAQADDPPLGANATFPETAYTRLHQTSGTTGTPLRVPDTAESWDWWGRCWGYVLSGAGLTAADRVFLPFSFGPFIGFWAAVEGARHIGALMIPGGGRDSLQRLQLMAELGATAMCCTPTYALRLAEVAREEGFNLRDIPLRATIHAGEPGANVPATKARIEAEWQARCFDHAGASEVGAHSYECEVQPGGVHAIECEFIIEALDPWSGEPVPPGEQGELVITNLGRIGYPVVRYRTGDLVRLNYAPCACGRTFVRYEGGVLGRADDMVVVRGVNVYPAAIENLIRRHEGIDEFQVTISTRREMGELTIALELAEGVDAAATRDAV